MKLSCAEAAAILLGSEKVTLTCYKRLCAIRCALQHLLSDLMR